MKHFIFDTETNGLPDFSKPAEQSPRLAHLAGICLDDDDPALMVRHSIYIQRDGWSMTEDATAINGITDEYLDEHGQPIAVALDLYSSLIESGHAVYAYGAQFDCKIMRGELRRAGRSDLFEETKNVCLMRALQGFGIEKANGKRGWPSLSDAARHFGIEHDEPHKAMPDAIAAYHIFRILRSDGKLPEPTVHHAAEGSKAHKALEERQKAMDL